VASITTRDNCHWRNHTAMLRNSAVACYAFELMSQIRLKILSHSWASRTRSEAGYEVEFGSEFNSQEQAACAGAESQKLLVVRLSFG